MALSLVPAGRKSGAALKRLSKSLAALPVPVIGRIASDRLLLDLRCLEDEEGFAVQLDLLTGLA
jgi:L-seryl-tRNA(Ser) seleniumtransferase